MKEAQCLYLGLQSFSHHTRLNDSHQVAIIDLDDPIHFLQRQHDSAVHRQGTARKSRARAARRDGDSRFLSNGHDACDFLSVRRGYNDVWRKIQIFRFVGAIFLQNRLFQWDEHGAPLVLDARGNWVPYTI